MAEPTSAPSSSAGAVNYFSINHLLRQPSFSPSNAGSKNNSRVDGESSGASSREIPKKESETVAATSNSESGLSTSDNDRLLTALKTSGTCVQPHFSLSLNPAIAAIDLLKQSDSFVDRKSDNDTTATPHFGEKSLLACRETTIPLWLNCAAATAAVLPFEQSFLMAQRSGKFHFLQQITYDFLTI